MSIYLMAHSLNRFSLGVPMGRQWIENYRSSITRIRRTMVW